MIPQDITRTLTALFGEVVKVNEPESWQVEGENLQLLVLLSEDQTWLRALINVASAQEAAPFLTQLLEANFDETQETRYAIFQNVVWGVFQHSLETLTETDFEAALIRLGSLHQKGITDSFSKFAETQVRQIIRAAKLQGQTLEATLQSLERFYEEGVMGDLNAGAAERGEVLGAWRSQLERLWDDV
jgi:hypothetical protein